MSKTEYIKLGEGVASRLPAGTFFSEPVLVEAGSLNVHIVLEAGAKLNATAFVFATAGSANLSFTVDLTGEGAEFHLYGLHIASGSGQAAINVRVNHLVPDCRSRQLVKGASADEATGSFSGMVYVARDAQRTDAEQQSRNLQLGEKAHIFTRPGLEIYADDVKCSHGASVGQLDEEAIYYMRQRGVSEAQARQMQLEGFTAEIINHCPSDDFRNFISSKVIALNASEL